MSMPPAGILGVMDEETLIEAEIAQQLEYINLDEDEDLRDIDAENNGKAGGNDAELPQEVHDYIHRLQEQTSKFEKDLQECDELLQNTVTKSDNLALLSYEDHTFMERLAGESGMDIEQYKKKLLEDLEMEVYLPINEDEDLFTMELSGKEAENETSHREIISTNSSTVLKPLTQAEDADVTENKELLPLGTNHAQFRKDFKKALKYKMEEIDRKHREHEERLQREFSSRRKEEEVQEMRIQEERNLRLQQREKEEMIQTAQRMLFQRKLEEEEKERNEELKLALKQIEKETVELEIQTRREKAELMQIREEVARKEEEKRNSSALLIQRMFKGYRVRKTHASVLIEKQKERRRQREQDQQREIEELEKKVEEEIKIQEELKRQKLKEEREKEEERKRKETEDKQRLEEEKKRQKQLEKQQKEEEKQRKKEKEQMRKQEEKRLKDEEKRRLEEKKKQKEEEEVRKKEEKRLKEEEERTMKEKLRKEREKQQEERKIKEEEERKIKEEEESKKQEEIKKQVERKRNEEEEKRQREKTQDKLDLTVTAPEDSFSQQNNLQSTLLKVSDSPQQNFTESLQQKSLESSPQIYSESSPNQCLESILQISLESPPHNSQEPSPQMAFESSSKKTVETKASVLSSLKERKTSPLSVDILPEPLETQRLNWMKNCISWSRVSNEPWKLKPATSKKPLRRPSSAKKLPLLSESVITAAARAECLRQVTTVQLQDLPGHNISPLGQCWGLKYLAVTNSALVAVEGLQQCKQLQYINFTNNRIEYLDLKDLGNLQYLNVSWNQLTTLHGLDNCTNLRLLDASHNKISRIGGVESLRRLHTLLLSHNQLINTKGLEEIPTIQVLDFSDNHLQNVDSLDKLCLLLKIDVSRNSLVQVPLLQNQVLLQELLLEDNSITSLEKISTMWIPLLHTFHLGQNGISEIHQIRHCLMLKDLSLRNNQLSDHKGILEGIIPCIYLENINLEENPVLEDISKSDLMDQLAKLLPRLQSLNGASLQSSEGKSPLKPRNSFEAMCLTQIKTYRDLLHHLQTELRMAQEKERNLSVFCDLYFKYCDKTFHLAVEHRFAHEYGEIPISMPTAPTGPKSKHPKSARTKVPPKEDTYLTPKEMFEKALQSSTKPSKTSQIVNVTQGENEQSVVHNGMINGDNETIVYVQVPVKSETSLHNDVQVPANVVKKQLLNHSESGHVQAAIKIQSMWKGYITRKEIDVHTRLWLAAIKIQAYWRGYCDRKRYKRLKEDRDIYLRMDPSVLKRLNDAATKIQAIWRGYSLRSRLHAALEYAHFDDDDDLDFQEVNLDEFVALNKDLLADDWKPPDTPQLPANYPILKKPPTGRPNSNHRVPPLNIEENSSQPSQPRRAWRNADSPVSDLLSLQERFPHPPSSTLSVLETIRTGLSRKEEKLSEEWGFQDTHTAQLMLQRAKKMKYNAERRKKLGKLDPIQKLALFRKLEETGSHLQPIQQPHRKILPRKEYFQVLRWFHHCKDGCKSMEDYPCFGGSLCVIARKDEIERQDRRKQEEMKAMVNRTYEWLHTQVGDYNITDSIINQDYGKRTAFGSESNLPKLDPEIVAGRSRVQLVSSPMSLELQSVESGSVQGDHMNRRLSSGGSVYSEGRSSILPTIKTGSAPTLHSKEKMSWRSPDVNKSVGWGGGKKRQAKR